MVEKHYSAEILGQEARGGGEETAHSVGIIALRPSVVVYDNANLQDIILGKDKEGLSVAPLITTHDATYFRATSARTNEYADLKTICNRIEELANNPEWAGLDFPHDTPFSLPRS